MWILLRQTIGVSCRLLHGGADRVVSGDENLCVRAGDRRATLTAAAGASSANSTAAAANGAVLTAAGRASEDGTEDQRLQLDSRKGVESAPTR
jgi:hypothetical protein